MREDVLRVGIDVGSTTTKLVVLGEDGSILCSSYERHKADQAGSVLETLRKFAGELRGRKLSVVMTGSGAKTLSQNLGLSYMQEVVANAEAIRALYPNVRTAIELGGQDAKIIFFRSDSGSDGASSDLSSDAAAESGTHPSENFAQANSLMRSASDAAATDDDYDDKASGPSSNLTVSDMRMNGSCAGGTGAFLDEMASILKVPISQFNDLASRGQTLYDISGRCGVYAKTDIQPLLNQGAAREDLALSCLHAIAKQTIGGLAQGIPITKPVIFEGGPLTYIPQLVRVFAERLDLSGEDIVIPEHPELMVARGAALSVDMLRNRLPQPGAEDARKEDCPACEEGPVDPRKPISYEALVERLVGLCRSKAAAASAEQGPVYFASKEEYLEFKERHPDPVLHYPEFRRGEEVHACLGIDSGSTTTKFVLMDDKERILDSFYAPNEGDPLAVAKKALIEMRERWRAKGVRLHITAVGTTGYGELLFHKAFSAESHVVETVAHARATRRFEKDATFLLDIGGQDMKAIWLDNGIITNIVVNEACSSGCGSFLQNFAASLHIPLEDIPKEAFRSEHPANLGSRCTVFMNSSIVTEQRNGKLPADIMAGLCRSIIENVFTKVIRISNLESLGDHIVVQGGTFENDAVLRAMEQYLGRNVTRAPYPGLMGAIGAAMSAKSASMQPDFQPTFIGLDALDTFEAQHEANLPCPFCGNHCARSVVRFPNGSAWVTNNRCERGEVLGDPRDEQVRSQLKERAKRKEVPNLFDVREKLLFAEYPVADDSEDEAPRQETSGKSSLSSKATPDASSAGADPVAGRGSVGLPRVLSYWDTMPFWSTFWRSLGFRVILSDPSTRKMYESGLQAVTSDTMCFPAKLVHGHIRNLAGKKPDFIFMPSITTMKTENQEKTSVSMCALVKGFPLVLRNSDNPETQFGVPLRAPLFHWYTDEDRERQLCTYMEEHFGISHKETVRAIAAGDRAQTSFRTKLKLEGARVIEGVKQRGGYAVILASRPYQNDALVNHDLPKLFTERGIPVLTADSVPGTEEIDLSRSRIDVVNNFHARMLSGAVAAAQSQYLEYVQLVSFGCGHDAYLSDEIIRMMKEISGKTPLILKLDESDVQGPLRIRVRSFLETLEEKRSLSAAEPVRKLQDPYPVKFTRKDKREKVILVPNTSHAFSQVMAAAFARQGATTVSLPVGRENAIRLGKQYVHNDICFPAQVVIGEALDALRSGQYDNCDVAIGMGRYVGDCRLTHYTALLRKALDDAGYSHVPIVTNDDVDSHKVHPGFKMSIPTAVDIAFAMPMIDELEELLRKIRPYEKEKGSADAAFEKAIDCVAGGLREKGLAGMRRGYQKAIEIMKGIPYDRKEQRPRVLIVGEYLLNFHPGANHDIEKYLEQNGMEVIEARMSDVIQKTYFYQYRQGKEYKVKQSPYRRLYLSISDRAFEMAHNLSDHFAASHPLFERPARLQELAEEADPVIPHTFDAGEGILIPGEIIHHAKRGCKSFIILQPFGCLPNHVVGRGITRKLKEMFPNVQILPLDYDPDVSFANLENRLQMLVMNAQ